MRNQAFVIKIEPWDEGASFTPALRPKRPEYLRVKDPFEFGRVSSEAESVKPVGFYIAYSYTLFRKGAGPHGSLFAFF